MEIKWTESIEVFPSTVCYVLWELFQQYVDDLDDESFDIKFMRTHADYIIDWVNNNLESYLEEFLAKLLEYDAIGVVTSSNIQKVILNNGSFKKFFKQWLQNKS